MAKTDPTLCDSIYAALSRPKKSGIGGLLFNPNKVDRFKTNLINAEKYVIEDEALKSAVQFGAFFPYILHRKLNMCLAPFDLMWMEWNHQSVLESLGLPVDEEGSDRTGALITTHNGDRGRYYRFDIFSAKTGEDVKMSGMVLPQAVSYLFSPDDRIDTVAPFIFQERSTLSRESGLEKRDIDLALLGGTIWEVSGVDGERNKEARENLMLHGQSMVSDLVRRPERVSLDQWQEVVKESVVEFSGSWRIVVSLLWLLSNREYSSVSQPARNAGARRLVGGKNVAYLQVRKVSVDLPRQVILRKASQVSDRPSLPMPVQHIEKKWHSHHKHDRTCDHEDIKESDRFYRCVHCKRARWEVREHTRGDSTVGFVTKIRVVNRRSRKKTSLQNA